MSLLRRRAPLVGLLGGLVLTGLVMVTLLGLSSTDDTSAEAAAPADLVPDLPRRDLPRVLDGTVFDSAQVGDWIVVGGDFTQLDNDGTVVDQVAAFAYNLETGELNTSFLPTITRNSGAPTVLAIEPAGDGSHVYLGGKFAEVNGEDRQRLVRISVDTGTVDTTFDAGADGIVRDIVIGQGRLFVGGEFMHIGGAERKRLAELDLASGAAVAGFRFDITHSTRNIAADPFGPKHLGVTPQGMLVVAHRGARVDGKPRPGVALIRLADNSLRPWRTGVWGNNEIRIVDAEVSPDGSLLVLGGDGGDLPWLGYDSAMAFSLESPNAGNQQPVWIARNFDSTYAVGITDDAVYVGGHFCWVESGVIPGEWPGDGEFTNNNSCHGLFPASRFAPGVVFRDQIAALDPATGHALLWDPGADGLEGVQSIEVIDRGLLIGQDGTFFGRDGADSRAWNVGRHAFLDIDNPGSDTSEYIDVPVLDTCNGVAPTITGTTRDDVLVGTPQRDVIQAGPGDDLVFGDGGDDLICGGEGRDVLRGWTGSDVIYGDDGRDKLYGGDGNDTLWGGALGDVIAGERGSDVLTGGRGADRLNGGAGTDIVRGSPGKDTLQGGSGVDTLNGGVGTDTCAGRSLAQGDNAGDTSTNCER
ncbi:MAG: calcium-binding protein [Acidimicrobiales bacterium]